MHACMCIFKVEYIGACQCSEKNRKLVTVVFPSRLASLSDQQTMLPLQHIKTLHFPVLLLLPVLFPCVSIINKSIQYA